MRGVLYGLFVSVLIGGCAAHQTDLNDSQIDEKLVGDWGWTKELCETAPDEIIFSDDQEVVEILLGRPRTSKSSGETIERFTFKILNLDDFSIKTIGTNYPPDSKQKDPIYHLRLVSENRICIIHEGDDRPCRNFLKRCSAL